jgi:hypothetical protein
MRTLEVGAANGREEHVSPRFESPSPFVLPYADGRSEEATEAELSSFRFGVRWRVTRILRNRIIVKTDRLKDGRDSDHYGMNGPEFSTCVLLVHSSWRGKPPGRDGRRPSGGWRC